MSDQAFTRIKDGCPACRQPFVVRRGYWHCDGCHKDFGKGLFPAQPAGAKGEK